MNIVIIQSAGKHKENFNFRECLCLDRALNRIEGINSFVWGTGFPSFTIPFQQVMGMADCVVILENYSRRNWLPDFSKVNKLKMFWSIDSHLQKTRQRHLNFVKSNKINITLNSTSAYTKHFKNVSKKSLWFPNCYPIDLIDNLKTEKEYAVGFCGNYANRKKFIDQLSQHITIKKDIFIIGQSMVKAVNSYKIHFNRNYANDINYRTFETLGCKTFLLTNKTDRLAELFKIGRHLVIYNNLNDCVRKIKFFLSNQDLLKEIANEGYLHVRKHHTYDNRAEKLVNIIKENI
jgi:spore maturation protein CgeB